MFTWIAAKLGSTVLEYVLGWIIIAVLAGGGYLGYKIIGWKHAAQVASLEKERDAAIQNYVNEKQKNEDLQKAVQFQRDQLARRQKVQKESSDVDKAVTVGDIDFFRRNAERLFDYKNPAAQPPTAGGIRKRFKPPAKAGEIH